MTVRRPLVAGLLAVALVGLGALSSPTPASGQAPAGDGITVLTPPERPAAAEAGTTRVSPASRGTGAELAGRGTTGGHQGQAAGGGSAESIIGADGRVEVTDTSLNGPGYPSRAIGQLEFTPFNSDDQFLCTGWLIDANTILTAGHCAYEPHPSGTHDNEDATFFPGRYDDNDDDVPVNPYGSCSVESSFAPALWRVDGNEYNDWALMQLGSCTATVGNSNRIGDVVGHLGYFARSGKTALRLLGAVVRGYPGEKPFGTMWTMQDRIEASQKKMVFYDIDTTGGQSGSPVYQPNRASCGGPCAMAIHAYGNLHGSGPHRPYNHGPRITVPRFDLIADLADDNGS